MLGDGHHAKPQLGHGTLLLPLVNWSTSAPSKNFSWVEVTRDLDHAKKSMEIILDTFSDACQNEQSPLVRGTV